MRRHARRNDMTNVYLAPGGGQDAARWCEDAAAQLQTLTTDAFADGLGDGWLGDCEEGRGWAQLLHDKAVGANSLRWLLECHVAHLRTIADQFRRSTGQYGDADQPTGSPWLRG